MKQISSRERRVILASAFGNTLEYYDFTLYGLLCPLLSQLFFPHQDTSLSIFMGLSLYSIGFLARPIGGLLFGYYGDKYGRKKALSASIILMSLSCFMIGLLPTYQQIGIYAPLLLTVARFLQGICVGGEYSGAVVFSLEHSVNKEYQNFSSSLLAASSHYGCLIASLVASFFAYTQSTMVAWRIPFLLGSLIGIWGLFLRYKLPETPIFLAAENYTSQLTPKVFAKLLAKYKKEIFYSITFISLSSVIAGFSTAFLSLFYTQELSYELYQALLIVSFGLVFYIMGSLFASYLLKYYKLNSLMAGTSILLAFLSFLVMKGLVSSHLTIILVAQMAFCFLSGIFWGTVNIAVYEFFPSPIRYLGIALSDTLARTIFGGTAPMVFLFLKNQFESFPAIGGYLSLFCIFSTLSCFLIHLHSKSHQGLQNEEG